MTSACAQNASPTSTSLPTPALAQQGGNGHAPASPVQGNPAAAHQESPPSKQPQASASPTSCAPCAVAVSGGADSLLTLLLLHEAGTPVFAIHARLLPPGPSSHRREARLGAICQERGIPLHVLDLSAAFASAVIAPFVAAYAAGRTPNPCAQCNAIMKWGMLWDTAQGLGAACFATGHYARLAAGRLRRGQDRSKDQSYFLALVPPHRLACTRLPLGDHSKAWVREELLRRGITPPEDAESQDICFVAGGSYRDLMAAHGIQPQPGPVALADGTIVGEHQGLWTVTIGQRRGLGIAYREPLFVLAKDSTTNTVIVGPQGATVAWGCTTEAANILQPPSLWPPEVLVQTSYRQAPQPASVMLAPDGRLTIRFSTPGPRPTPGQVAALYANDEVLAGAVIASPLEQP